MTNNNILPTDCIYTPDEYAEVSSQILPREQRNGTPVEVCVRAAEYATSQGNQVARLAFCGLLTSLGKNGAQALCRECGSMQSVDISVLSQKP